MTGEPTMVRRRTFTPSGPEPDDHPPVVDAHGDVWQWEQHDCDLWCRADGCEAALYGAVLGGWWSPTAGVFDLLAWAEIWDGGPGGGERDLRVAEVFPDEVAELIGERERGPVVDLDQMGACEHPERHRGQIASVDGPVAICGWCCGRLDAPAPGPPLANGHEVDMFTAAWCAHCRHSTDDGEPCDEFVLTVQIYGAWSPILDRVPTSPTRPLGVACHAYAGRDDKEGAGDEKDSDPGADAHPRPDA